MGKIIGRTVLIVEASSGIGAEVARQLAPGGNRLVLVARRAPELASVADAVRLPAAPAWTSPPTPWIRRRLPRW